MKNKIINYEMNNREVPLNKCSDFLLRKTYFQQNRKNNL